MITIVFRDENGKEVARISEKSNAEYLSQEEGQFKCLGEVYEFSPSLFRQDDMLSLITDLLLLRQQISPPEQIRHIDEIIRLAKQCQKRPRTALLFTTMDFGPVRPVKIT